MRSWGWLILKLPRELRSSQYTVCLLSICLSTYRWVWAPQYLSAGTYCMFLLALSSFRDLFALDYQEADSPGSHRTHRSQFEFPAPIQPVSLFSQSLMSSQLPQVLLLETP